MNRKYLFKKTAEVKAAQNVASKSLDDETALNAKAIFPFWGFPVTYAIGDRVQYADKLYKCVQIHTSQADWTPDIVPALWTEVSVDEFPEWKQPTGAQDAYNKGDKVSYNNKHWMSDIDGNVWAPGVYGWSEV